MTLCPQENIHYCFVMMCTCHSLQDPAGCFETFILILLSTPTAVSDPEKPVSFQLIHLPLSRLCNVWSGIWYSLFSSHYTTQILAWLRSCCPCSPCPSFSHCSNCYTVPPVPMLPLLLCSLIPLFCVVNTMEKIEKMHFGLNFGLDCVCLAPFYNHLLAPKLVIKPG